MQNYLLYTFEILLVVVMPLLVLYLKVNWPLRKIIAPLVIIPVEKSEIAARAPQAKPAAPAGAAGAPAPAAPAAAAEREEKKSPDGAYIETIRCSTCNECTQINDNMFSYNENKQAYIKYLKAGTYRQLVEAAESCQLGIIHPGKPINPKEPGLEELLERAKPFL